jgi:hypothetical protein
VGDGIREIENPMPKKELSYKTRMFRTLLTDQFLPSFEYYLRRMLKAEELDVLDNKLIELVLRDVGLEYILKCAIRIQSII